MEIRTPSKYYDQLVKLRDKHKKELIVVTKDDTVNTAVMMVTSEDGKTQEWVRGIKSAESIIINGYNKIIKKCPYSFARLGKCKGPECQLYLIENNTGDCSMRWSAIFDVLQNRRS